MIGGLTFFPEELNKGTRTSEVDSPADSFVVPETDASVIDNWVEGSRFGNTAATNTRHLHGPEAVEERWATFLTGMAVNFQEEGSSPEPSVAYRGVLLWRAAQSSRRAAAARQRSRASDLPRGTRVRSVVKWEGRVLSVDREDEVFTAELQPLLNTDANIEAEFLFTSVADDDLERLRPGSILYVTVRSTRDRNRQPRTETTVRVRQLGRWSQEEIEEFLAATARNHESDADLFE
jgi:hypothetical protein